MSDSLSLSMVHQTSLSHNLTSYLVGRRREHFINHLPKSITKSQKKRLAASSPFSEKLFDPEVLDTVISEFKGDLNTSAQVAMTRMVPPANKGRRVCQLDRQAILQMIKHMHPTLLQADSLIHPCHLLFLEPLVLSQHHGQATKESSQERKRR